MLPHIISAKDFTRAQLDALFERAGEIKKYLAENYRWTDDGHIANPLEPKLAGRKMLTFFDQPSLRTSTSFEASMEILGGTVGPYRNMTRESSIAKDESLEDTFEAASGVPGVSVIVLRHPEKNAAKRVANSSSVPVINAGDGSEHPTQALVDLFTIQEALGSIDRKNIALVGDLHARTARSLLYTLMLYPNILLISMLFPDGLGPEHEVMQYLCENGKNIGFIEWKPGEDIVKFANSSNVLYVLRPQTENWEKDEKNPTRRDRKISKRMQEYYNLCTVNNNVLQQMPKNSIVLHPRPRGPELPTEVDSDPRVRHVQQGRNGGPVRIALLEMMHSGEWLKLANK